MRATRPFIVEVLGVAGAGKTTLVEALACRDGAIRAGIPVSRSEKLPLHLVHIVHLLPTYVRHYLRTRWLTVAELRGMAYAVAWRRSLERRPEMDTVVLLDHGPLFRLATLDEFGPPVARSATFLTWWQEVLAAWAETLDAVVWLDAPDHVLLHRIRSREQPHEMKHAAEADALQFIARYRAAYERVVQRLLAVAPVAVLRFSTARPALEHTVAEVMRALAVERSGGRCDPAEARTVIARGRAKPEAEA